MHLQFMFLFFSLIPLMLHSASSKSYHNLTQGSYFSPEKNAFISSPTGNFAAGFYPSGDNAYFFAIWFTQRLADGNLTIVWMANRDKPVNGQYTRLILSDSGNIVLEDAGQIVAWKSDTTSTSEVHLHLRDDGNLVLYDTEDRAIWESFNSPTDTLLPLQPLTRNSKLISSRSQTNYSSGVIPIKLGRSSLWLQVPPQTKIEVYCTREFVIVGKIRPEGHCSEIRINTRPRAVVCHPRTAGVSSPAAVSASSRAAGVSSRASVSSLLNLVYF